MFILTDYDNISIFLQSIIIIFLCLFISLLICLLFSIQFKKEILIMVFSGLTMTALINLLTLSYIQYNDLITYQGKYESKPFTITYVTDDKVKFQNQIIDIYPHQLKKNQKAKLQTKQLSLQPYFKESVYIDEIKDQLAINKQPKFNLIPYE